MSWPIGYAKPEQSIRVRANGIVLVDGVDVTDADGWIDLPSPASARVHGAPNSIAVQLRPRVDIRGRTYLYLGAVRIGAQEYDTAQSLQASWVGHWLSLLPQLVHAELAHRAGAESAFRGPSIRPSGQYARSNTPAPGVELIGRRRRRTTGT